MATNNIISHQESINKGLKRFFTGVPCANGHVAERMTKSYRCVICKSEWEILWRLQHPEQSKIIQKREYERNSEKYYQRSLIYYNNNTEKCKKTRATYKQKNKGQTNENINKRRAQKIQATPAWYEKSICQFFYDESARLTEKTGILHHVDHIIPLINKNVCGLHCADNLQVLTAEENLKKSNTYP